MPKATEPLPTSPLVATGHPAEAQVVGSVGGHLACGWVASPWLFSRVHKATPLSLCLGLS